MIQFNMPREFVFPLKKLKNFFISLPLLKKSNPSLFWPILRKSIPPLKRGVGSNYAMYPFILSIANGGFASFVNFRGPNDKPFGKTTNFQSFEFEKTCVLIVNFTE